MEHDARRDERAAEPKGRRIAAILEKGGLHDDARSGLSSRPLCGAFRCESHWRPSIDSTYDDEGAAY